MSWIRGSCHFFSPFLVVCFGSRLFFLVFIYFFVRWVCVWLWWWGGFLDRGGRECVCGEMERWTYPVDGFFFGFWLCGEVEGDEWVDGGWWMGGLRGCSDGGGRKGWRGV